jgi:hypothetical protein
MARRSKDVFFQFLSKYINMVAKNSKYNARIVNQIVEAISSGMNQRQAAKLVGISEETLSVWKKTHPILLNKLERSSEEYVKRNLQSIAKAGQRSWQATAWLLERTRPELYSPKLQQDIRSNQPVVINVDMQGTYKPPQSLTDQAKDKASVDSLPS